MIMSKSRRDSGPAVAVGDTGSTESTALLQPSCGLPHPMCSIQGRVFRRARVGHAEPLHYLSPLAILWPLLVGKKGLHIQKARAFHSARWVNAVAIHGARVRVGSAALVCDNVGRGSHSMLRFCAAAVFGNGRARSRP